MSRKLTSVEIEEKTKTTHAKWLSMLRSKIAQLYVFCFSMINLNLNVFDTLNTV